MLCVALLERGQSTIAGVADGRAASGSRSPLHKAVVARGPILAAKAIALRLAESPGYFSAKLEAHAAAGGRLAEQANILGAERDGGAGLRRRMQHDFRVGRIKRRLE